MALLGVVLSAMLATPALAQWGGGTPGGLNCQAITSRFQATMASGYTSKLLINSLRQPRGIALDSAGNLLAVEQGGGGVRWMEIQDSGTSACVGQSKQIINDASLNHGIAVSADGKLLFVSSLTTVYAYDYDPATQAATNRRNVVTGMSNGGLHLTRTLMAPKTAPEYLVVQRGSDGNIDTSTTQQSSGRSMAKAFKISDILTTAVAYNTGGQIIGWGLRNSVGWGEDPSTGGIWSVENSMDDVRRNNADIHNENPAEEVNYHGVLNDTANALLGQNFGYPTCVAAWQLSGVKTGTHFVPNGQNANDVSSCQQYVAPILSLPSHTAPLDIKFKADGSAAYISLHGSWDRQPPDGYRIIRVDFKDGKPTAAADSTQAGVSIMANPNLSGCPNSCFRPTALALDAKNRLFMSSDQSGEIYVVTGI